MGRYRKVDTRIWNDAKFSSLGDKGRLAFLFILTHPNMTSLGCMRATIAGLASELGWTVDAMRNAVQDAVRYGMLDVNERASFVGLPKFLKYNPPTSPNAISKAWIACLDLLPECPERDSAIRRALDWLKNRASDTFRKQLPKTTVNAMRHAVSNAVFDSIPKAISDAVPDAVEVPSPIQEQLTGAVNSIFKKRGGLRTDLPSPSLVRPRRNDLHAEMTELANQDQQFWGRPEPILPPDDSDDHKRIVQALDKFGFKMCQQAVDAYLRQAKATNSRHKNFWYAFPALRRNNNRVTNRLDEARFLAFASDGRPPPKAQELDRPKSPNESDLVRNRRDSLWRAAYGDALAEAKQQNKSPEEGERYAKEQANQAIEEDINHKPCSPEYAREQLRKIRAAIQQDGGASDSGRNHAQEQCDG